MSDFKKQALMHATLLLLMVVCMAVARKPGMEPFYFFAGMLCLPVLGSMRDLFFTLIQRIRNA